MIVVITNSKNSHWSLTPTIAEQAITTSNFRVGATTIRSCFKYFVNSIAAIRSVFAIPITVAIGYYIIINFRNDAMGSQDNSSLLKSCYYFIGVKTYLECYFTLSEGSKLIDAYWSPVWMNCLAIGSEGYGSRFGWTVKLVELLLVRLVIR